LSEGFFTQFFTVSQRKKNPDSKHIDILGVNTYAQARPGFQMENTKDLTHPLTPTIVNEKTSFNPPWSRKLNKQMQMGTSNLHHPLGSLYFLFN